MIETKIDELIAALNANTAAVSGGKSSAAPAGDSKPAGKPQTAAEKKAAAAAAKKASAPKFTKQEVTEAIVAVKDTLGSPSAKKLLGDSGFAKLADITEDKFDELYANAKALLPEPEEAADEDDDAEDDI